MPRPEIIAVASGKGGTGKTLILASLGYALQSSGRRVLFIDSDTATDGLSLFLLGPDGWREIHDLELDNTFAKCLNNSSIREKAELRLKPFRVNRAGVEDHGQFYNLIISRRNIYRDENNSDNQEESFSINDRRYKEDIKALFESIRNRDEWDVVLIDTRGGFAYTTVDVCALADSFFIVTEANFSSFYQDRSLFTRIMKASESEGRQVRLRGIVVNKASESSEPSGNRDILTPIDMEKLDIHAVSAYKAQQMPYRAFPASLFSYASLVAFSGLMRIVTAPWPQEQVTRWNTLVGGVSQAIRSDNKERQRQARKASWGRRLMLVYPVVALLLLVISGASGFKWYTAMIVAEQATEARDEAQKQLLVLQKQNAAGGPNSRSVSVCIGEVGTDCPFPHDARFSCGTSREEVGAQICGTTINVKRQVSPYRILPQRDVSGGQCGYTLLLVTCLDEASR